MSKRIVKHRYVPEENYSENWGKETLKFYNMMMAEIMRLNLRVPDLKFAYYSITDTRFWTTEAIWKRALFRFWLEMTLSWLRVYNVLKKSKTQEEFWAAFNLDPTVRKQFVETNNTRQDLERLAAYFNKPFNRFDQQKEDERYRKEQEDADRQRMAREVRQD